MRRIAIGLVALWVSVYVFLHETSHVGSEPIHLSWSALGDVPWGNIPVRVAVVCGFLAVAGLVLVIRGIGEEIDH